MGIYALAENRSSQRSSKLRNTSPFLDGNGLLRIGGRLSNSLAPYDFKHPIILPGDSSLVKLIIRRQHLLLYHGGSQVATQVLRQKYWIVGGRNVMRRVIFDC